MTDRIARDKLFMDVCDLFAQRSTCYRQNVGAIITYKHRIVSTGYNGSAPGEPHCLGSACPLTPAGGCSKSIHAEVNALNFSPKHLYHLTLYVSLSPCLECANRIIESGRVEKLFYRQEYRVREGLDLLIKSGVQVFRVTPAGHIINATTNQLYNE